jgi:hypothetical protein
MCACPAGFSELNGRCGTDYYVFDAVGGYDLCNDGTQHEWYLGNPSSSYQIQWVDSGTVVATAVQVEFLETYHEYLTTSSGTSNCNPSGTYSYSYTGSDPESNRSVALNGNVFANPPNYTYNDATGQYCPAVKETARTYSLSGAALAGYNHGGTNVLSFSASIAKNVSWSENNCGGYTGSGSYGYVYDGLGAESGWPGGAFAKVTVLY